MAYGLDPERQAQVELFQAVQALGSKAFIRSAYNAWRVREVVLHVVSPRVELDVMLTERSLGENALIVSVSEKGMFGRSLVSIEVESLVGKVDIVAEEVRRWLLG
ncbi:hypothetical protein WBP06_03165 [Novosphingobium sp. BL-8H]|uniref:hypothetical protein n=1 Tax=Novosphingobium sp. BL-8H TaxID=3127640 RepID=UPI003756E513